MACAVEAVFLIPERSQLIALESLTGPELSTTLKCGDEDASILFSALVAVRSAVQHHPAVAMGELDALETIIVTNMANLRSAISRIAVIAASELVQLAGDRIVSRQAVDVYVSALLTKASGDKKFIRDPAIEALRQIASVRNPTALLYMTLIKNSITKNRSTVLLSAELACRVLKRLPVAEFIQLDLLVVARFLASYSSNRSSEARSSATAMSRAIALGRGLAGWKEAVTAVCCPQECRDLLLCLSDLEISLSIVDVDDKENSCATGTGLQTPCRPNQGKESERTLSRPGVPASSSGGLREYLRVHSAGRSNGEPRRTSGAFIGCTLSPDRKESCTTQKPSSSTGKTSMQRGSRQSLGACVTPLLVLQRNSTTPRHSNGAPLLTCGGACTALEDELDGIQEGTRPGREPIVLQVGDEAAALLEGWNVVVCA